MVIIRFEYKCRRCAEVFFGESVDVDLDEAVAILEDAAGRNPLARIRIDRTLVHRCDENTGCGIGDLNGFTYATVADVEKVKSNLVLMPTNESAPGPQ